MIETNADPGGGGPWRRLKRGEIAAIDLEDGEEGRSQADAKAPFVDRTRHMCDWSIPDPPPDLGDLSNQKAGLMES